MKRRYIVSGCMLMLLALLFSQIPFVAAKTKPNPHPVSAKKSRGCQFKHYLDSDKGKVDKYKSGLRVHLLEKGKTYRLKSFLNMDEKSLLKEELITRIKKKPRQKITLSGEGIKIKKQTFCPEKEGLYMLKVETTEDSYIFPIYAVNKEYKVNLNEVDKISITVNQMGKSYTALVQEPLVLRHIVDRINRADYSFDFAGSRKRRVGNTGFTVGIQWKDGRVTELNTLNYGGFSINTGWVRAKWSSDSQSATDFVDYIGQVFDNYLPKYRGKRSIC